MHVALLFPPVTDPRSPHLGLPSLAAVLRGAGARVTMRDLDLECLLSVLTPARVQESVRACERRLRRAATGPERDRLRAALAHAGFVAEHASGAPAALRDAATFYDPHEFHAARECIVKAQELAAAASGAVRYGIGPVRYEVDGFSASRLNDLIAVTADPRHDLFDRHLREALLPDLDRDRPDLVGVSILNHQQIIPGLTLARALKERGHTVVIGGTLYSKFVPQLLQL